MTDTKQLAISLLINGILNFCLEGRLYIEIGTKLYNFLILKNLILTSCLKFPTNLTSGTKRKVIRLSNLVIMRV